MNAGDAHSDEEHEREEHDAPVVPGEERRMASSMAARSGVPGVLEQLFEVQRAVDHDLVPRADLAFFFSTTSTPSAPSSAMRTGTR